MTATEMKHAPLLMAVFDASKRVEDLCPNDVARYTQARRSRKRHHSGRVRRRTAQADLVFLRTMLIWATAVRLPDGEWLLTEKPASRGEISAGAKSPPPRGHV